ncbi:MAG: AIR synthase-related protein, partial [Acidobacteriota bacterium]
DGLIKGLAHITGGGLVDNIPRILPENVDVLIEDGSWPVLPVYRLMERIGNVPTEDMRRTFNLGIGMVIITDAANQQLIEDHLAGLGEACYRIGQVVDGDGKVRFA